MKELLMKRWLNKLNDLSIYLFVLMKSYPQIIKLLYAVLIFLAVVSCINGYFVATLACAALCLIINQSGLDQ